MTQDNNRGGAELPPDMAERMRKAQQSTRRRQVDKAMARAPKASVVRYGAVIVLAVLTMGMIVATVGAASDHEAQVRQNLAEIGELNNALEQSKVEAQNIPDAQVLVPALDEAALKGEELGVIQNEMAALDMDVEDRSQALIDYGDLVTDAEGYFSAGAMTGGSFLPQGQWFQPHEPGRNFDGKAAWVRVNPEDWTWTSIPTKSIDPAGNVTVLWVAEITAGPQAGSLMAWVLGKYDSRRGVFFDMQQGLTPEGFKRVGATTSPPDNASDSGPLELAPSTKELIDQSRKASSQRASERRRGGSAPADSEQAPAERDTADSGLGGN